MTTDEKVKKIQSLVSERSKNWTKAGALKLLQEEGILSATGDLTPEYGGKSPKTHKPAQAAN